MKAIRNGDIDLVTFVIDAAPPNERDILVAQGLSVACEQNQYALVERMLSYGADPSQKFGNRAPPLLIAVTHDRPDIVKLLLEHRSTANEGLLTAFSI